jgi:hypothetical protein
MNAIGWDLAAAIRDLAELDAEGQLSDFQLAWASECRGWTDDRAQLFTANELLRVQVVSRALAGLFDLPRAECDAAVRSVLLQHPRRQMALSLIEHFLNREGISERLNRERAARSST